MVCIRFWVCNLNWLSNGGFVAQFGYSMDTVAAAVYLHSLAADEIYRTNYIVRPTAISQKLPQLMKKYSNIK